MLDFTQPVAVTLLALLHALPDADNQHAIVAQLMNAVPLGSYLAISHMASDLLDPEAQRSSGASLQGKLQQQYPWRDREQVTAFFVGIDLVDFGLVPVKKWRPVPGTINDGKSTGWCAIGRKR